MNLILRFESEHVWECALADEFLSLEKITRYRGSYLQGNLRMEKMWQKAGIIIQRRSPYLDRQSHGVSDECHRRTMLGVSGSPRAIFLLADPHRKCSH